MTRTIAMLIGLVLLLPLGGCGKYENTDPTGAKVQVLYDRQGHTPVPVTKSSDGK